MFANELEGLLLDIKKDDLLNIMKNDPTTEAFYNDRVFEMIQESIKNQ